MTFPEKFIELPGLNKLLSIKLTMGNGYLIAWAHRISGIMLIVYVLLHVNTLSSLADPEVFTRKAELFSSPIFLFFEWLLAVPVIFHCLNGGRLLVYELFTTRYDKRILTWVCGLSCIYMLMLGYFMILSDQSVSPHFYWFSGIIISLIITYPFAQRVKKTQASIYWKLQRVTGAFLFMVVPAHMLFMHLNHRAGRDVQMIIERLQQPLVIVLDILLLLSILYHGGYGLITIGKDYLADRRIVKIVSALVIIVLALFALQGIMLIGSI